MNLNATNHPDVQLLSRYHRGEVDQDELALIESHILACDSCCQRLQELPDDSLVQSLRNSPAATARSESTAEVDGSSSTKAGSVAEQPSADGFDLLKSGPTLSDRMDPQLDVWLASELDRHPRYRIQGLCGVGGMGAVYRAEHRLMSREVALKVINPKMLDRPEVIERFRREVKAAAQLSHPNIVTAHDAEQIGKLHLLVMEYVDGQTLAEKVETDGLLSPTEACDYIRQAALGLQHAHERGMVHRDIKPHNLMLASDGLVKVLDFGLATLVADEMEEELTPAAAGTATHPSRLTHASTTLGTPDYIAPEQIADPRSADVRADIYGLGCTLYFLLTGQPPFAGGSAIQKIQAHAQRQPPAVAELRHDVPPQLSAAVARMMAKNPDERYQSPAEVAEALTALIEQIVDQKNRERSYEGETAGGPPGKPPRVSGGGSDSESGSQPRRNRAAFAQLQSPANGLLAVAILNLLSFLAMPVYGIPSAMESGVRPLQVWAVVSSFLLIPIGLLMIQGGLRMRNLESRGWGKFAAYSAMLPLSPVAWPLGILFGIWSLAVLRRQSIELAFAKPFAEGNEDVPQPVPMARPPVTTTSLLRQVWDEWWARRDRWVARTVQSILVLLFLFCEVMFFSYHVSQDAGPEREGRTVKRTIVQIGTPSPWFYLIQNPDKRTFHAFKINFFTSSVGIGLIGFLFYGASWQIEKAMAAAAGQQLRWWHGSPNFVLLAWAAMVFFAVIFGTYPLYLDT